MVGAHEAGQQKHRSKLHANQVRTEQSDRN
jgi:hypothetical protein